VIEFSVEGIVVIFCDDKKRNRIASVEENERQSWLMIVSRWLGHVHNHHWIYKLSNNLFTSQFYLSIFFNFNYHLLLLISNWLFLFFNRKVEAFHFIDFYIEINTDYQREKTTKIPIGKMTIDYFFLWNFPLYMNKHEMSSTIWTFIMRWLVSWLFQKIFTVKLWKLIKE